MNQITTDVRLDQIEVTWEDYPRAELDEERVLEFRELLRDPDSAALLPPIEVVPDTARPGRFSIGDGFHRYHAHLDDERETISAIVLPAETDVFLHGVQRAAITAK